MTVIHTLLLKPGQICKVEEITKVTREFEHRQTNQGAKRKYTSQLCIGFSNELSFQTNKHRHILY